MTTDRYHSPLFILYKSRQRVTGSAVSPRNNFFCLRASKSPILLFDRHQQCQLYVNKCACNYRFRNASKKADFWPVGGPGPLALKSAYVHQAFVYTAADIIVRNYCNHCAL